MPSNDCNGSKQSQRYGVRATVRSAWKSTELSVGKDLQYIRLNGTVVGGLVGVLLYGAAYFLLTLIAVLH